MKTIILSLVTLITSVLFAYAQQKISEDRSDSKISSQFIHQEPVDSLRQNTTSFDSLQLDEIRIIEAKINARLKESYGEDVNIQISKALLPVELNPKRE